MRSSRTVTRVRAAGRTIAAALVMAAVVGLFVGTVWDPPAEAAPDRAGGPEHVERSQQPTRGGATRGNCYRAGANWDYARVCEWDDGTDVWELNEDGCTGGYLLSSDRCVGDGESFPNGLRLRSSSDPITARKGMCFWARLPGWPLATTVCEWHEVGSDVIWQLSEKGCASPRITGRDRNCINDPRWNADRHSDLVHRNERDYPRRVECYEGFQRSSDSGWACVWNDGNGNEIELDVHGCVSDGFASEICVDDGDFDSAIGRYHDEEVEAGRDGPILDRSPREGPGSVGDVHRCWAEGGRVHPSDRSCDKSGDPQTNCENHAPYGRWVVTGRGVGEIGRCELPDGVDEDFVVDTGMPNRETCMALGGRVLTDVGLCDLTEGDPADNCAQYGGTWDQSVADRGEANPCRLPDDVDPADIESPFDSEGLSPEACERLAGEAYQEVQQGMENTFGCDWSDEIPIAGSTEDECTYRPPVGQFAVEGNEGNGNQVTGLFREIIMFTGAWFPSYDFEVPEDVAAWYQDELLDHGECHLVGRLPHPRCDSGERIYRSDVAIEAGQRISRLMPDDCWGDFPFAKYDIGYDGGGLFNVENTFWGGTTNFIFGVGKNAIQVSFSLVNFGMAFDLTDYAEFAVDLASVYETELVGPLMLRDIAWLVLMGYVTVGLVRGKYAAAGGEFLVTVLMLALVGVLLANVGGYMQGASDTMDGLSGAMLAVGVDGSDEDGDRGGAGGSERGDDERSTPELVRSMQLRFHQLFVADPYDYLNWGEPLTGTCAELRDHILSTGPHGTDRWPRDYMRQSNYPDRDGCAHAADYNAEPGPERLFGAFMNSTAALLLAILLGLIAFTLIIGKFIVAILFAVAPLAAATAVFPGSMRKAAWSWLATLIQAMVAVVGMSALLALLMITVDRVLRVAEANDMGLWQRWLVVSGIVAAMLIGRKKLLAAARSGGQNVTDRLSRLSPAAAGAGFGGSGAAGGSGSALLGAERGALGGAGAVSAVSAAGGAAMTAGFIGARTVGAATRGVTAPVRGLGRFATGRMSERRAANRTLQNQLVENVMGKTFDDQHPVGGRGGSGGGSSGLAYYQQFMRPKGQRKMERAAARMQRVEAKRVDRAGNPRPRNIATPVVEAFRGRGAQMKTALVDHNVLNPNRWSRERYPDPVYTAGGGRAGRHLEKQIIRRATAPGTYHTWTAPR